jgi:4'-phosphopantetheinyl transferase
VAARHPRLREGEIHVWRADLTAVGDDLLELLSPAERARAAHMRKELDRQLWGRARGVLRALLGRYLASDPRSLRFMPDGHGKPALVSDAPASPAGERLTQAGTARLSFNLSHSQELALYAFTETGAIGVDVQVARRPIDELALAARAFGPAQTRHLEGLDPGLRAQAFLRLWVRHEAELKCRGTGIGGGRARAGEENLWTTQLEMGPRAAAAVAVERPPRELRRLEWSAS